MLFKKTPDFVHYGFGADISPKNKENCSRNENSFSLTVWRCYVEIQCVCTV